jgi:hypothetical protein
MRNIKPPITTAAAMGAPTFAIKSKISIGLPENLLTYRKTLKLE